MLTNQWVKFWQDGATFNHMMRINTQYFAHRVQAHLSLCPNDSLLDIGCGPGYLEGIYNKVGDFCRLDVSEHYVALCRDKFKDKPNSAFHLLPQDDYLNLECLGDKKFSVCVVFSMIQYYNNIQEVETLIRRVQERMKPGGILIIGDIANGKGALTDLVSVLSKALRHGFLFTALRFFSRLFFSEYRSLSQCQGLLSITESQLQALIRELDLEAQILPALTLQRARNTLIVKC